MSIPSIVTTSEDQAIEYIEKAQGYVLEALKAVVGTVEPVVPDVAVPLSSSLPTPAELVDNAFTFASRLLAANRAFAEKLVEATSPLVKVEEPPAKPASKTTVKAA